MTAFGGQTDFAAVDLFCGAGGLTHGLRQAGIPVVAGVDIDETCRFPLEANNPGTAFIKLDVNRLRSTQLDELYPRNVIRILAGCAPCQPFSKYAVRSGTDDRWRLLQSFLRLLRAVRPEVMTMENVEELQRSRHVAYVQFMRGLAQLGYAVSAEVIACADYGVPQTRRRLVIIGRLNGPAIPLHTSFKSKEPRTVRDAIGQLAKIRAGDKAPGKDPLHVAPALSELNVRRIRATPEGGSWRDWPSELLLHCHKKESGKYYGSVYGRMAWDELAPTITTQCFGYGNGRFGHPSQDRAISLREAALLQTFPATYQFVPHQTIPTFKNVGRQIGNAVPVALARAIGQSITAAFFGIRAQQCSLRTAQ